MNKELAQLRSTREEKAAASIAQIRHLKFDHHQAKNKVVFHKIMSDEVTALLQLHEASVDEDI